ncbi:unnamed protein product [Cylicocyclus nassatus]|uniref:Uncharacterized protein n=1 Tax=Cylicocyclus nassatus TaxID=53992 RepID=A0AA36M6Y6_CYLNA|nr:unnamed protein product [Cylicocyclus nassatus]
MDHFLIHGGLPLKYQCTNRSQTHEMPNVPLGVYCIVFGLIVIADLSELIAVNNMLTVTLTFALYFAFFFSFLYKYHLTFGYRMSYHEKQIFIQSTAISAINLTLALIYVYMLYFPAPITMIRATLFLWHFSTCA